ncbi:fructose-bisphosphate aldolase [candidate division KSB1 bacterium]|nr:MAG: fructose-bisphosphate aldolase [candidate division KSB1 bacterium]
MEIQRPKLDELDLSLGKRVRLHRLLYEHGPGNGTLFILPIDQGVEHGPVDFFANPESIDPDYQYRLALNGGFSGIALHYGLAVKYMRKYCGKVPLILKLNGKTNIPSDKEAFSPLTATVEDAVRLGADAIGYTLYVGSPAQDKDILQFTKVRDEAEKYGMPVIMWSYPRGEAIEEKGGRDSLYAVDYAARIANEFGADIVKLNLPKNVNEKCPEPYKSMKFNVEDAAKKVVRSAGKTMVLFSGGSKLGDEDLLKKVRICMNAGATGLIFGRNMWQRKYEDAMKINEKVKKILLQYSN